jgi:hypothetical protein
MLTAAARAGMLRGLFPFHAMPHLKLQFGPVTWLSFIAFVLLLLAFTVGRPVWHAVAQWRARQSLEQARTSLEQGRWAEAAEAIGDAHGELPDDAEVLRVTATFLDKTQSDPHLLLQILRQLEEKNRAEAGDIFMRVRALISARRHAEAREVFASLSSEQRGGAEALLIEARLLREEGNHLAANEKAQRAHTLQPADEVAALELAIAESWNTPYDVQTAAIQRLWTLAEAESLTALAAIRHLADQSYLVLPQAEKLLRLAEAHPLCPPATRLAAVSAIIRKAPERRGALLDAEVARYRSRPVQELVQVAFWLAAESEHDRLMEICPLRTALESEELFRMVALSLAHQKKWKELCRIITEERVPAAPEQVGVWLAWAEGFLQPDMKHARRQLESAIVQGKKTANLEVIRSAAQVAEIHGLWDLALDCHAHRGKQLPDDEVPLLERSYEIARLQTDGQGMLALAQRLRALRPTSSVFAERATYLSLVLGVEIESSAHAPTLTPSKRSLLAALTAYRLGNSAAIAKELTALTETSGFQPGERAVYAGLLALSGQTSAAFQIAEKIPTSLLLAEEKRFLKHAQ